MTTKAKDVPKPFSPDDRVTLSPAGVAKGVREAKDPLEAQSLIRSAFSLPMWTGPVR